LFPVNIMSFNAHIDILLAAYNGEEYLKEQIDSILCQSYDRWNLIIRDDGSGDNTPEIIRNYSNKYSHKIKLLDIPDRNRGIKRNFSILLEHSSSDYIMFCDQDDLWLPEKIEITYKKMKELETLHGKDLPLLIHGDLKVADKNLKILSPSFWQYQKLNPRTGFELNRLIVQNVITGCTLMINKKLKDLLLPVPDEAVMYDWWTGLVACAFGKMAYITDPLILYRQHGRNDTGAKHWSFDYIRGQLLNFREIKKNLLNTQKQAKIFLERYKDRLSKEDIHRLKIYSSLDSMDIFSKRFYIFKYGFFKIGFIRNMGLFLTV